MTNSYCISVIIPTYRRRDSVARALEALAQQTLPPNAYEVIVVIDGSLDGTHELVMDFPAVYALRALWQPNRGRAAACNAGIRAAAGVLLVLLDDDMEPALDFLAAHLRAHSDDARLGVLGAVPVLVEPSSPPVVAYIGAKFDEHLEKLARPGHAFKLRDFYSGNFSIRREIMLAVGLFNEAFKIYGNEDLDLSLRLARKGVRLVYSPAALARQHYTKDFAGLARDTIAKGRTAVLLASKHDGAFDDLKLNTYREGSRRWRLLRATLLGLSRLWAGTPDLLIRLIMGLERRRPGRARTIYHLALDYFYWLGARAAQRERTARRATAPSWPAGRSQL